MHRNIRNVPLCKRYDLYRWYKPNQSLLPFKILTQINAHPLVDIIVFISHMTEFVFFKTQLVHFHIILNIILVQFKFNNIKGSGWFFYYSTSSISKYCHSIYIHILGILDLIYFHNEYLYTISLCLWVFVSLTFVCQLVFNICLPSVMPVAWELIVQKLV